jgi:hypothetical protein
MVSLRTAVALLDVPSHLLLLRRGQVALREVQNHQGQLLLAPPFVLAASKLRNSIWFHVLLIVCKSHDAV